MLPSSFGYQVISSLCHVLPWPIVIFEIADRLTDEFIALRPSWATIVGAAEHQDRWEDLSPPGWEQYADFARRGIGEVQPFLTSHEPVLRHGARVIDGHLQLVLDKVDNGDHLDELGHVGTPLQESRDMFDLMRRDSRDGWDDIIKRLHGYRELLRGYTETLDSGLQLGRAVAIRQVDAVTKQASALAGEESPFDGLGRELADAGFSDQDDQLTEAIEAAKQGCHRLAEYLATSYRTEARSEDGVGRDRYERAVLQNLGASPDLHEIYLWGWDEIAAIRTRLVETARIIDPTSSVDEVLADLEREPCAGSQDEFADFVRERQLLAMEALDGVHFDVPPQAREVKVNLAPPNVPLGAWYYPPSEDFSRLGSIWYALGERQEIALYGQVSTAYHEGFPGHHLQGVLAMSAAKDLCTRYQRLLMWSPGYDEGWGLYAERLMDELGFFERPEYVMGYLTSQMFRACRVVIDIGCHLKLPIPDHAPFFPGRQWDFDTAVEVMRTWGRLTDDNAESEVLRYLGLPAQAIAYKVGERLILDLRERAGLPLKEFHRRVLGYGPVRLDYLEELVLGEA